jgi:hypothetical protein
MYMYTYYIYTQKYCKNKKITLFYNYLVQTSLFAGLFYFPTVRLGIAIVRLGHEYMVHKSITMRQNSIHTYTHIYS